MPTALSISPIELRHRLHSKPELMFEEFRTTEAILEALSAFEGIKIYRPIETGLVVEYSQGGDDEYLLFRADIDALPVKEETGWQYASENDCMHACGHDVHASVLFGLIRHVVEAAPKKNILFLFQPGEEGGGGAGRVIASGIFNDFRIKHAFALHVTDEYTLGTVASTKGVLFASAHEVDIEIYGRSAHVAFPSDGIHSFNVFRSFLNEVENLLEQQSAKIVFGYGKVTSGTARNIIPAMTRAECTIRSLSKDKTEVFVEGLKKILDDLKSETGIEYDFHSGPFYNEVIVDDELYDKCTSLLKSAGYDFIDCGYKMTGEDFGFFSRRYPSFMFWLGVGQGEKHGLHNSKFLPPDEAIEKGISIFRTILAGF